MGARTPRETVPTIRLMKNTPKFSDFCKGRQEPPGNITIYYTTSST
ncbi:hypothetical protein BACCAP_01186 [Pseudoflavonifractor capillosus ATCC 29799]|uniref:Uncharacterized protein n=1 Tax=Pseudoflavonifractor capillosus ATCC 29799 TaxID=411467 RepID=A6NSK8_9FIRM|nr:hypothetical protein BACCAP_01186 [Pseudoflavonifractor capillosus ATCC 29799]